MKRFNDRSIGPYFWPTLYNKQQIHIRAEVCTLWVLLHEHIHIIQHTLHFTGWNRTDKNAILMCVPFVSYSKFKVKMCFIQQLWHSARYRLLTVRQFKNSLLCWQFRRPLAQQTLWEQLSLDNNDKFMITQQDDYFIQLNFKHIAKCSATLSNIRNFSFCRLWLNPINPFNTSCSKLLRSKGFSAILV